MTLTLHNNELVDDGGAKADDADTAASHVFLSTTFPQQAIVDNMLCSSFLLLKVDGVPCRWDCFGGGGEESWCSRTYSECSIVSSERMAIPIPMSIPMTAMEGERTKVMAAMQPSKSSTKSSIHRPKPCTVSTIPYQRYPWLRGLFLVFVSVLSLARLDGTELLGRTNSTSSSSSSSSSIECLCDLPVAAEI